MSRDSKPGPINRTDTILSLYVAWIRQRYGSDDWIILLLVCRPSDYSFTTHHSISSSSYSSRQYHSELNSCVTNRPKYPITVGYEPLDQLAQKIATNLGPSGPNKVIADPCLLCLTNLPLFSSYPISSKGTTDMESVTRSR